MNLSLSLSLSLPVSMRKHARGLSMRPDSEYVALSKYEPWLLHESSKVHSKVSKLGTRWLSKKQLIALFVCVPMCQCLATS